MTQSLINLHKTCLEPLFPGSSQGFLSHMKSRKDGPTCLGEEEYAVFRSVQPHTWAPTCLHEEQGGHTSSAEIKSFVYTTLIPSICHTQYVQFVCNQRGTGTWEQSWLLSTWGRVCSFHFSYCIGHNKSSNAVHRHHNVNVTNRSSFSQCLYTTAAHFPVRVNQNKG